MSEVNHPLENVEVVQDLKELADLLEIRGDNPFRIRAYRNAIRTIQGLTTPLMKMVEEGEDLTELPGVGKDISGHIHELFETGTFAVLEEITAEIPRELALLVRIEGLGPKKVAKLHRELDVVTADDLEAVLKSGQAEGLDGFGKKSVEKFLLGLDDFRKHQGRFLLSEVDLLVAPLLAWMEEAPGVEEVQLAGSARRRRDTVGDLDLLVRCDTDRAAAVEHFTAYPGADRVEVAGETKARIRLRSGLSVDLRLLGSDTFGSALQHFSGSKEHNVAIRSRAVKAGLRVSEYGVFEGESETPMAGATEEEVYAVVGLPWIPPVLREDRGEIEAAEAGELPTLIQVEDVRGDLHMHSTWSDGKRSIREMVDACRDRGYGFMAITDHSQAVTVAGGLTPQRVREQWEEVDEVRAELEGFHLFRGCEVDILKDGSLDLPDDVLHGLDLVIASVHSYMDQDQATMTERVITAMRHPAVDFVAHPTGRLLNRREPFEIDMDAVLEAAADLGVGMEINANPRRLDLNEFQARRAKELGVMLTINTDAHDIPQLAYMRYGIGQAQRAWLCRDDVLNAMSGADVERWLGRRSS
jgi:DNA polymerase (family 10)